MSSIFYIIKFYIFNINSNTPGFQVIICDEALPLRNVSDDLKEFLNNRLVTGLNNNDYDNDEDHEDSEDQQVVKKVKKNKRKRGKKG